MTNFNSDAITNVQTYPYDIIKTIQSFRNNMHHHVYSDPNSNFINTFIRGLDSIDLFSVEYDPSDNEKIIKLKVKVTNMKKKHDYSHNSNFYSLFIESAYKNALIAHNMEIRNSMKNNDIDFIINTSQIISSVFKVCTVVHNMVYIYL